MIYIIQGVTEKNETQLQETMIITNEVFLFRSNAKHSNLGNMFMSSYNKNMITLEVIKYHFDSHKSFD